MKNVKYFFLSLSIIAIVVVPVMAAAANDQPVAQALDVQNPGLLPDSPFYFLKEWIRNLTISMTFDNVKKAELQNKYANEKIVEMEKMAEKNGVTKKNWGDAIAGYRRQIEMVKTSADSIKDSAKNNSDVKNFMEKFDSQEAVQQQVLQKLQNQVPSEVYEKIEQARQDHLQKYKEVMEKVQNAKSCPLLSAPAPDFCKDGSIRPQKNDSGCITGFRCVTSDQKLCTMEYNPVCGKDGKTYGNKCQASAEGVEIDYNGECNGAYSCTKDSDCPTIYCFVAPCPQSTCVDGKCKVEPVK